VTQHVILSVRQPIGTKPTKHQVGKYLNKAANKGSKENLLARLIQSTRKEGKVFKYMEVGEGWRVSKNSRIT
jgi:hypothetical protein